jgi:UDP-N-acetylmuramoylalanine--D-glutamate ligase
MRDWNGLRVVIVGAARQGIALARFLAVHGARVVLTDSRPEEFFSAVQKSLVDLPGALHPIGWVCGEHPLSLLDDAGLLCLSGGVAPTIPLAVEARARGIPLSNDSLIFLEQAPCKVIGITGSAGKSTTTSLVGAMAERTMSFQAMGNSKRPAKAWVGGNIGSPLISALDEMEVHDLAVMELSSFQLELMDRSPQVAALLNVTPNHLDRHGSMAVYTAIKGRILDYQSPSDIAILGRDDKIAWSLAQKVHGRLMSFGIEEPANSQEGAYLRDDKIYVRLRDQQSDLFVMPREAISLRGEHNLLNVLAACAIAAAVGLPAEFMSTGTAEFTGMPHRLEFVRSWDGVSWYNDSIATAPERTMAAIRAFNEPLVLLSGGRDNGLPWDDLAALVYQNVDHLIIFGEAAETILQAVAANSPVHTGHRVDAAALDYGKEDVTITMCSGLREAVRAAVDVVEPGDVVLLSPGGTSFDEFNDFEERGECFVQLVKDLT